MSDLSDLTPDNPEGISADTNQPDGGPPPEQADVPARLMITITELTAHPGNVREDLELTAEFCASIASAGVRIPLLVTPVEGGGYRVIEGHRRLAAAVKAGLEAVPCDVNAGQAADEAGQYMDMLLANSEAYRKNFAPVEEAAALFAAHEAGASRTRLRKATGRKAEEIKTALKAAQISPETRSAAGDLTRQLTLEELALLAEFDGDDGAISRILDALHRGYNVNYEAERIRQDRAEAAAHQRLLDELTAAGIQISTDLPPGAVRLSQLLHDGEDLTAEAHAACPGRGAFFPSRDLLRPAYYSPAPRSMGTRSATACCPSPRRPVPAPALMPILGTCRLPADLLPRPKSCPTLPAGSSSRATRHGRQRPRCASAGSPRCCLPAAVRHARPPSLSPGSC